MSDKQEIIENYISMFGYSDNFHVTWEVFGPTFQKEPDEIINGVLHMYPWILHHMDGHKEIHFTACIKSRPTFVFNAYPNNLEVNETIASFALDEMIKVYAFGIPEYLLYKMFLTFPKTYHKRIAEWIIDCSYKRTINRNQKNYSGRDYIFEDDNDYLGYIVDAVKGVIPEDVIPDNHHLIDEIRTIQIMAA